MADSRDTPEREEDSPELSVGSAGGGRDGGSEEEVYTLLFREVDSGDSGLVAVDNLVDYLRSMQLGTSHNLRRSREEVYDSQEDVQQVQYNLQLLRAMLEVSAVEGKVDQDTYSHVIRLWVKDVRDRSNQQAAPSLEVSQLSDSEEEEREEWEDGGNTSSRGPQLSFAAAESFETSGGSSTHSTIDRLDLLSSLQDVRLDNSRLTERVRQLQASADVSEEQVRAMHTGNSLLQQQLHSVQQQLARLEGENTDMEQSLGEERRRCAELTEAAETMSQQLTDTQREVASLRERVAGGEEERDRGWAQTAEIHAQLQSKEEMLTQQTLKCSDVQTQLDMARTSVEQLRSKVGELEECNASLHSENVELHSTATSGPSYSTPSRSNEPPSLHDELSRHGNLTGHVLPSPLVGVETRRHDNPGESCRLEDHYDNSSSRSPGNLSCSPGNISLEDLEHMAQSSSSKFHSKTEMMVKLLSELLNTPPSSFSLPPRSSSTHTSRSSDTITEVSQQKRPRDGNMRQLVACVKKLYSEKKQLKLQIAELQARLNQKQLAREDVDAAVQTTPPQLKAVPVAEEATPTQRAVPVQEKAVQTLHALHPAPSPAAFVPQPAGPSCLSMCARTVGGVVRGVTWALALLVLLGLLLTVLVWLQSELQPCCHGCPLTPGGLLFSMLEPHVSASRHGYT